MRRVLFIVLIVLIYSSATFSQKQPEMNQDVYKTYKVADKKLNEVYQKILKKYKAKGTYIKNIRKAQRLWIKFRDAQFEMNFPESNGQYNKNTLTDSQAAYLTQLTEERTKTLKELLDPGLVGLIAYYPFDGTANDNSGNGNHGIIHGATLTSDRFGKSNSAYHFTGGAYIRIPELFPDSCSAFTFAAWVKEDAKDNASHVIIYKGIQKGEASLIITPGILGFGVNLYVPGTSTSTQNWYAANTTDTLRANTYYFLVGRYIKGQKVDLSINGIQVSSSTVPNLNLVSDSLRTYSAIGDHTDPGHSAIYWWNGVIDDIRIYKRALSNDEVQSLYHEGGWSRN
jgi:uncharacterized protein YecT (DUF1311 family)